MAPDPSPEERALEVLGCALIEGVPGFEIAWMPLALKVGESQVQALSSAGLHITDRVDRPRCTCRILSDDPECPHHGDRRLSSRDGVE